MDGADGRDLVVERRVGGHLAHQGDHVGGERRLDELGDEVERGVEFGIEGRCGQLGHGVSVVQGRRGTAAHNDPHFMVTDAATAVCGGFSHANPPGARSLVSGAPRQAP